MENKFCYPLKQPYIETSPFGPRESPITGEWEWATGWDIVPQGDDGVYASGNGEIVHVGYHHLSGWNMKILYEYIDNRKWLGWYSHLARKPKSGAVKVGGRIAQVGATGTVTGKHLDMEVHLDGRAVDPHLFLDGLNTLVQLRQMEGWLKDENKRKDAYWDWLREWELTCRKHGVYKPEFKCMGNYCTNLETGEQVHLPPV